MGVSNFIDTDGLGNLLGAKRVGMGWEMDCPAHGDNQQSLTIRSINGKASMDCRGGCPHRLIAEAIKAGFGVEVNANSGPGFPHRLVKTVQGRGHAENVPPMAERIISLRALLEKPLPEIEFLVHGLVIRSGIGLLAGKPKAGKSTLSRILALSVARGTPFLGLPVRRGRVLYYGLEEIESEIRRHFQEMGGDGPELDEIFISTQPIPGREVETLRTDILQHKPSLVIVDPLFRAIKVKDASAYAEVSTALEPLLTLARESGAHILCVHHLGKGARSGGDAILGSTAIRGAFDVNLILNKTDHHRTIQSEGRYIEGIEESVVEYDREHGIASLGDRRLDADSGRIEQEIVTFLEAKGIACSQKEIDGSVNGKTIWKRHALSNLRETGRLTRRGKGTKGDPYLYSKACSPVPALAQEQGNKNQNGVVKEEAAEERALREAYEAANGR